MVAVFIWAGVYAISVSAVSSPFGIAVSEGFEPGLIPVCIVVVFVPCQTIGAL